jgi:nicotinate-nucleotide pyrophosphorylase (carboxylating)
MDRLIRLALAEDLGSGDATVAALGGGAAQAEALLVARESVVFCGAEEVRAVYHHLSPAVAVTPLVAEGRRVAGPLLRLTGPVGALLGGERTALNFLMRLCGIATATRLAVDAVPPECRTQIYDTRKTVPGWRALDKRAVRVGGGYNHRAGLYDGLMFKDNHWSHFGAAAVGQAAAAATLPVVVEVDRLAQLKVVLPWRPEVVLLDNFSLADLRAAVRYAAGAVALEASGGVTLASIPDIARTGVDRISIGALTHSVRAPDLSMELQ